jgi:hypothetical protein
LDNARQADGASGSDIKFCSPHDRCHRSCQIQIPFFKFHLPFQLPLKKKSTKQKEGRKKGSKHYEEILK